MFFSPVILLGLTAVVAAHPGHQESEYHQALAARTNTKANKRALEGCAAQLQSRGIAARGIERRRATVEKHRQARDIPVDGELF